MGSGPWDAQYIYVAIIAIYMYQIHMHTRDNN